MALTVLSLILMLGLSPFLQQQQVVQNPLSSFFGQGVTNDQNGVPDVITLDTSNGMDSTDYLATMSIAEDTIENMEVNQVATTDIQSTAQNSISIDGGQVEAQTEDIVTSAENAAPDVPSTDVQTGDTQAASQDTSSDSDSVKSGDSISQSATIDNSGAAAPDGDGGSSSGGDSAGFLIPLAYAQTSAKQVRILPDAGILPDSPFYGVKRFFERADMFFTTNQAAKVAKQVKYNEIRLSEANELVKQGKLGLAQQTIIKYQDGVQAAQNTVNNLNAADKTTAQSLLAISSSKQKIILDRLNEKVSDVNLKGTIAQAQSKAVLVKDTALSGLKVIKPNTAIKIGSMTAKASGGGSRR